MFSSSTTALVYDGSLKADIRPKRRPDATGPDPLCSAEEMGMIKRLREWASTRLDASAEPRAATSARDCTLADVGQHIGGLVNIDCEVVSVRSNARMEEAVDVVVRDGTEPALQRCAEAWLLVVRTGIAHDKRRPRCAACRPG